MIEQCYNFILKNSKKLLSPHVSHLMLRLLDSDLASIFLSVLPHLWSQLLPNSLSLVTTSLQFAYLFAKFTRLGNIEVTFRTSS